MDAVLLARIQFALTAGFHFIFPPLSIGMSWMVFWFMTRYSKTRQEEYRQAARFWIRIMAVTFAVGVATGIVMEFQFGTNWADYSRYVGDIFGAPLAAEGLLAFFLESTFLGILLFGEGKLKHKTLTLASFMVAFGSTLSAFWIIVANSWQQTPAGFEIVNGRAELTSFFGALFNPSTIPRFTHVISGSFVTAGFLMFGLAALYILRRTHIDLAKKTFRVALVVAAVGAVGQLGTGHHHAIQVSETQPAKLAAFEGLFETQRNAPLVIIGIPDEEAGETHGISVPSMLSFLVGFSGDQEVRGLRDFPRDQWPPILASFIPFHLMFLMGMYFIGFTLAGLFLLWKKKLFDMDSGLSRLYMKAALYSMPLPIIANILGWFAAEMGRQPWAVQGLLRVDDAVSTAVLPSEILFSIILFTAIYTLLLVLWIFLIKLKINAGPEAIDTVSAKAKEVAA